MVWLALKAISDALNLSAETLLAQAGLIDAMTGEPGAAAGAAVPEGERAIRADNRLSGDQKGPGRGLPRHARPARFLSVPEKRGADRFRVT